MSAIIREVLLLNGIDAVAGRSLKYEISPHARHWGVVRSAVSFKTIVPNPRPISKANFYSRPARILLVVNGDSFNFTRLAAVRCITWWSLFWVFELLFNGIEAEAGRSFRPVISLHACKWWVVWSTVSFKAIMINPLAIFKANLHSWPARSVIAKNGNSFNMMRDVLACFFLLEGMRLFVSGLHHAKHDGCT